MDIRTYMRLHYNRDEYSNEHKGISAFSSGIRGETVGVGMAIRRKWYLNGVVTAIKSLFLAPKMNYIITQNAEACDFPMAKMQHEYSENNMSGDTFGKILKSLKEIKEKFENRNIKQFVRENACLGICYSYLNHLKVSCLTVAPFLIAITCQQLIHPNTQKKILLNTLALRILSLSIGLIHVARKISPYILPLEVVSLQSNGPSEISGIEVGIKVIYCRLTLYIKFSYIDYIVINKHAITVINLQAKIHMALSLISNNYLK
jgi:hypothetical protein